jgi:adenylate cyclase
MVLVLLIGGFPVALVFAWIVELNASRGSSGKRLNVGAAKLPLTSRDVVEDQFGGSPAASLKPEGPPPRQPADIQDISPDAQTEGASLVVLPFANMSGDPDQDFFADGLTEDITTELSRFGHLFIISRNSAFKYKGSAVGVRQVARELNVQYVVEGSVRKVGNRVRVTVQLVDARTDRHVWAERYDRQIEDIFALQDEVTRAIVATLPGRVDAASGEHAVRKPTANMTAYECVLAGKLLHHRATAADNSKALELLDRAIALDPNYAQAHAWKACTLGQSWVNGYCSDRDATWKKTAAELQIALQLNSNDSDVHRILAAVNLAVGQFDKALYHEQRALDLNPNDDLVVVQQGEILTWVGQPEEGIRWIEKAMRLNPYHPERFWFHLARAFFVARRYSEAASALSHITAPNCVHHSYLAACFARLGDEPAAHEHADEVLKLDPRFSIDAFLKTLHYKRAEDIAHHRAALLKAGLPEFPSRAALES